MVFTLQPVHGKEMIGRETIIDEMLNILKDKRSNTGYAIYGIRRVGKTSILKEIELTLRAKKDIIVVYLSLWEIIPLNLENLLEELVIAILEQYKDKLPIKQKIKELMETPLNVLKSLIKRVKLTLKLKEDIELLLSFKKQKITNYTELFKKAFSLPEQLAGQTKTKCVLILDEFPSILELREGRYLARALRTLHEEQKNTAFCIAGSVRKTMDMLVLSSSAPFYKQFLIKEIDTLEKEDVKKLLKMNFAEYKIKIDNKSIDEIYRYTNGIPYYIQFLGKITIAKGIKYLDFCKTKEVIKTFLAEEGNAIFRGYLDSFSAKEQSILSVIAAKNLESSTKIAIQLDEAPNKISTYILYLIDKGVIRKKERGRYCFVDNMFKEWLKSRVEG